MRARIVFSLLIVFTSLAVQAQLVKVDGSSTVYPLTEAVAEEFLVQNRKLGYQVTVGISGTGGGFKKFCRGETDLQNASRPIQESEIVACKKAGIRFIELPIAFDAIAIVAHTANNFLNEISIEDLKKIWEPSAQNKITKWNQVRKEWPAEEIKLFGAGADSGTFDYFTEAVMGQARASRGDYTASEDDNTLIMGISREKSSLGYVPFSYYRENQKKIKAIPVVWKGKKSFPTFESIKSGEYAPLSRPLFVYVSEKALKRPEVQKFAEFYIQNSETLAEEVQSVPLPATAYTLILNQLKNKKWGTVFQGHSQVGMSIDELLKKEKK